MEEDQPRPNTPSEVEADKKLQPQRQPLECSHKTDEPDITCSLRPDFRAALLKLACMGCGENVTKKVPKPIPKPKPKDLSKWYWDLKKQGFGHPPSPSEFRSAKHRWLEKTPPQKKKGKLIHPYKPKREKILAGGEKRKLVEHWGRLWASALSDLQFERTVFENNPDAEQRYTNDNERINDGCQKLCSIAKMNQNIIAMMMKKFVSGPPNKLYTLNRIEAAQCWDRIINKDGLVSEDCCVDLPVMRKKGQSHLPSLRRPKILQNCPDYLALKVETLKLPPVGSVQKQMEREKEVELCLAPQSQRTKRFRRNPTYWLDPNLVPPVPAGFKDDEFYLHPQQDPTGEIRRDLQKAKEVAMRYTRFAHIIERAVRVVPNLEKVNKIMDENFVSENPEVRRQTMLHNFFSSSKMETSPEFKKDAMFATILSREDNPKQAKAKKQYPYILAEISKSKAKARANPTK